MGYDTWGIAARNYSQSTDAYVPLVESVSTALAPTG